MSIDSFNTRGTLCAAGSSWTVFRLDAMDGTARLPYSFKVLLENLVRNEDGRKVTADQITALARWDPAAEPAIEIQFTPARVLMQDFTGVPCLVDLVAMREAMAGLGGDPARIDPRRPVELVIDHSVIADHFGSPEAFERNVELEYERNRERYQFLRWGQGALRNLRVVPPGTGICHQVNLEHLARVVFGEDGVAFPDTLVGTDSHTPMVNGLGVLGWGVGGIEAEAAMLGLPMSMLIPRVIGVKLAGALPEGSTATDLVLTIAETLRTHGVVGAFVEFYGPGVANVPLANRATIGNMSPEYGATCAIFPIDAETLSYLRLTGRGADHVALVEAYAKEQGLWHDPDRRPDYSETLEVDLSTVVPSIAGPKRPQDRIALADAACVFRAVLGGYVDCEPALSGLDESSAQSFPASDPFSLTHSRPGDTPTCFDTSGTVTCPPLEHIPVSLEDGTSFEVEHGAVVIAAITSCTNTSNPDVMVGAALLAKKAVERGLKTKPWVKTTLAPGSKVVIDYFERAGLTPYLNELGFDLVGYGCTTCIGNSGPLIDEVSRAVAGADLAVAAVLSGNRNFEGRIHPETKLNYLASPPLVVAYALAGSMNVDLTRDPLGLDATGEPVYLRDIWPSGREVQEIVSTCLRAEMFGRGYADVYAGGELWRDLPTPEGELFTWDADSTYVRRPPYFESMSRTPEPLEDIEDARVLALLGDSVTTDHISPAGSIKQDSPAGRYLSAHGLRREEFNSYGSRRGNHEVMIRGTFANIRLRNLLAPGTEGGFTRHLPDGEQTTVFDAAMRYAAEGVPLLVIAGRDYGSGSSRDWAAKGTALLGVRVVLAESFERIHRSNLVGMGVLPLQFAPGQSPRSLGLTGEETFTISGLTGAEDPPREVAVTANGRGDSIRFTAKVRIDTPTEAHYYRHGGILPYVLRSMLST
ncbi:aconitate hydratase [Sphaerimonospora thailandensis]|uniref:Aconitate hydratase A n=1 Tax=Sphaerimonospora thailandensis TaxID=795644 RepID=A0A8J3RG79_9ACTN|nr:aconitate hydratase [Sphaerimonospora thailandensis]GIH71788.1 aconitate hydratase [Sphaerimonospora thailandensis]